LKKVIKIIFFWIVAFSTIIFHTMKNKNWHIVCADFEVGTKHDGFPVRKKLIARRSFNSLDLYWQTPNLNTN